MAKKRQAPRTPRKLGRPSKFTKDIADAICERIADGESLRSVCRDEAMPDKATVLRWLNDREEFRDQYAQAREQQADHWADEIVEISDNSDLRIEKGPKGGLKIVGSDPQRDRLRVETRRWLMARMAPKKYGDRVVNELVGKDGGPIEVESRSTAEVEELVASLAAKHGIPLNGTGGKPNGGNGAGH